MSVCVFLCSLFFFCCFLSSYEKEWSEKASFRHRVTNFELYLFRILFATKRSKSSKIGWCCFIFTNTTFQHGMATAWQPRTLARRRRWRSWSFGEYKCACRFHTCVGRCSTKYRCFLCGHYHLFQANMATRRSNLHIYLLNNCTLDHDNHIEGCDTGKDSVSIDVYSD